MSHVISVLAIMLALTGAARAEEAYYDIPLDQVQFVGGSLPAWGTAPSLWENSLAMYLEPYAVLHGAGEVCVWQPPEMARRWRQLDIRENHLIAKGEAGQELRGTLFAPNEHWTGMVALEFSVPAEAARPEGRRHYYERKAEHFAALAQDAGAGAAWFRHQAREARRELGEAQTRPVQTEPTDAEWQRPRRGSDLEEAYALFSGGRAIAENLQLDRPWPTATQPSDLTVEVASLPGITVAEANWAALLGDAQPKLDALSSAIPADQHALFLPSFAAAMTLADEVEKQSLRVLPLAEEGSQDAGTLARYERQLGLSRTAVARLLGPSVIFSLAITGGDPYFRTGTDVAVLFEARQPAVLEKVLLAQVGMQAQAAGVQPLTRELEVKRADGTPLAVRYTEHRTADRSMCSYVAVVGGAVVVTNSRAQLQRLAEVEAGAVAPLAGLPEYRCFRSQYAVGDAEETGLVFLSDATIRRWCGARWRIGSARRTMAAAVLAELQARHAAELAAGAVKARVVQGLQDSMEVGEVSLDAAGVHSAVYGGLGFLTPIAELDLAKATAEEARLYERWREGYQRNWRNFFDPIALRISCGAGRLGLDLTVMPLIANSEYRELTTFTGGAEIGPTDGDPHGEAILHHVMALDPQSPRMRQAAGFAMLMAPGVQVDPLGWLGKSVALYLDEDPIWAQVPAREQEFDAFMDTNWHRIPVAVRAEVSSGLKLAAFLTALRAVVQQTAPGMTTWEALEHNGRAYVKVSTPMPTEQDPQASAGVYYFVTPTALTVTLREDLLKRAMDRWGASTQPSGEAAASMPATAAVTTAPTVATQPTGEKPWLGKSIASRWRPQGVRVIERLMGGEYEKAMRRASWANLAALNEWKRRWPKEDPLAMHERLWGVRLVEPAGGQYVWNGQYQTMESSVFGCPAAPKQDVRLAGPMGDFTAVDLGLTFEHQGLRARVELERTGTAAQP